MSLEVHLTDQLVYLDTPLEQLRLLRLLIARLDEDGYLTCSLEQVAADEDRPVAVGQVADALSLLQTLHPPGVGARDLRECLLLQLTPQMRHRDVVRVLIRNHLEEVHLKRFERIQQRTGFSPRELREAIQMLQQLNPKPGRSFSAHP